MDDVRRPVQLLDGFNNSFGKENRPFVIVREQIPVLIGKNRLSPKIFLVVNEVDLHALLGDRGHFDDQGHVHVVDDQIHSRQTDYLVQLMSPLIDHSKSRHEHPNLGTLVMHLLWHFKSHF